MKNIFLLAAIMAPAVFAQKTVNLTPHFNADIFLEQGGTGQGDALDAEGRRIDSATLPATYADGSLWTALNGRAVFQFGPLQTAGLDAARVDGQTIDVEDGKYSSIDMALLSAPGSFVNPFPQIEFVYADGSSNARLGPVAGWFSRPTIFDNALLRYSDQSGVTEHLAFATNGSDDADYLQQAAQSAISGGWRFADANGFLLYVLDTAGINAGKLGVTVGNNFVVAVATDYFNPISSKTEGYTVLGNSMTIHNGVDHRALGNLREYEFDVTEQLAANTGTLYVLLYDASPADGWGPFVQRIRLFDGAPQTFEERLQPVLDTSDATVYANFQIASTEENPFLYENNGAGPSNRGHRFADGSGSITYRFDLPDNVANAKMTVDMENNFIVSLAGPASGTTFAKFGANSAGEAEYLVDAGNSATQPNVRFADGDAYMIYQFDLPDTATTAFARVHVGNQYVIEAAVGADGEFTVLKDYVAETGDEITNLSNLAVQTLDISSFLQNNPTKVVRIRLRDGVPVGGWGPYLRGIEIADSETAGALTFAEVLNSETMFGVDVKNESNRDNYTVDLSSVLGANNPNREVYVRFTDGSTADGWGPSIYWMSVYTGEIDIQSDELVFPNLKTTLGDPEIVPVGLLSRNYPLDPTKTLTAIKLPAHPENQASSVYLLSATLNSTVAVEPPRLNVERIDNNRIRITWVATDGFRLQTASSLTPPAQWTDVSGAVNTAGTMTVEAPAATGNAFYRLIK